MVDVERAMLFIMEHNGTCHLPYQFRYHERKFFTIAPFSLYCHMIGENYVFLLGPLPPNPKLDDKYAKAPS